MDTQAQIAPPKKPPLVALDLDDDDDERRRAVGEVLAAMMNSVSWLSGIAEAK
jgi:hypothetical protein